MAKENRYSKVLWGYVATALGIGSGLFLLPVALHYLSAEEVGLWFVFMTLAGLAQILETGFQSTLTRNTAYIYAGAQVLLREGLSPMNKGDHINAQLLVDLVEASRIAYRGIAAVAAIALLGGGTLYIISLMPTEKDVTIHVYAWWMFALGYIAGFYYGYFNPLLQGRGDIAAANKALVITRGSQLIVSSCALMFGYGLVGIGAASLISNGLGRWVARSYYVAHTGERYLTFIQPHSAELLKTLWHNSSRIGVVTFGTFLIQRANILIASSSLGLSAAASYGMTTTIFMAIAGISSVVLQVQLPRMSALQAQGDKLRLRSTYGAISIISLLSFAAALIALFLFGDILFAAISSSVSLLPTQQLLVLGLIFLLEVNNGLAGAYLTTINKVPFVGAILWSGLGIVIVGVGLLALWDLGIWALVIAQGIVQVAYNDWKWPKEAISDLGGDYIGILKSGRKEIYGYLKFR